MKIKSLYFVMVLMVLSALSLTSCKKEGCTDENASNYDSDAKDDDGSCVYPQEDYNVDGLEEIGSTYAAGAQLKLYAKQSPFVGYNYLYVLAMDSATGKHLDDGHIELKPMMDMGMHKHSAPVENPHHASTNDNGLFEAQIYFVMPSGNGTWEVEVHFHNHETNQEGMGTIPVIVNESGHRLSTSFTDTVTGSGDRYFLCYVMPNKPTVGMNDFELAVFKHGGTGEWPAVDDLTLEMEPSMPSMGHGSPNNEHPSFMDHGHYKGKVNYSMTGLWRIDIKVMKDGKTLSNSSYFEYTL